MRHEHEMTQHLSCLMPRDSSLERLELRFRLLENVLMQRPSMCIHRDNRHEVFAPEVPDRSGRSEVEPVDAVDALDRRGTDLRGAADRMEINRAVLFARGEIGRASC